MARRSLRVHQEVWTPERDNSDPGTSSKHRDFLPSSAYEVRESDREPVLLRTELC